MPTPYPTFFKTATGHPPYPWQGRLANGDGYRSDDPTTDQRRIRGVQDGDTLPACRLPADSNGTASFTTPPITLDLSPAELFSVRYGRSWRERTSGLLAVLGPFRLAYLEALIRAADGRGSAQ